MTLDRFPKESFVLLDGAMGTMLQQKGLKPGEQPELIALTHPEWLKDIHGAYVAAGTRIVYTDTFGANREKLGPTGRTPEEVIPAAVRAAREAAGGEALVALDIGPLGRLLQPAGDMPLDEAVELFGEMMALGEQAGADLIVLETMADLQELRAGLLAAKGRTHLPVLCTMTFEACGRTYMGCSIAALALTAEALGAAAVGVNCSLGPRELPPLLEEMARWTTLPLIAKPNAGLPVGDGTGYDITPEEFAESQKKLAQWGVRYLGGCCGTSPDYIALLKGALDGLSYTPAPREVPQALCTPSGAVLVEDAVFSPADALTEDLLSGNGDDLTDTAQELLDDGADVLVLEAPGLTLEEERAALKNGVLALQGYVNAPVCLRTRRPEAAEEALKAFCGKGMLWAPGGQTVADACGALWRGWTEA